MLRRNLDRARERGFSFYAGPEMEFFYFADGDPSRRPSRSTAAGYFDLTDRRRGRATCASAPSSRSRRWASPCEYSFHEDAPSQHEIDLRYTDALTMADNVMTFRLVVKEIALERGVLRHVHAQAASRACRARACTPTSRCSRATSTPSTTPATSTACRRSAKGFIAGLLHHAREITAVTNQLGQLLQAARRRLRGARLRLLGPQQPLGARAVPLAKRGKGARPASSTARPTRRATPTSPSR